MSKDHLKWLVIGVLTGIVLRSQVDRLPLVNKIPSV